MIQIPNHDGIGSSFDKTNFVVALDSQFSSKAGYAFLEAENIWLSLHIPRLEFLIEFHAAMISKNEGKR